MRPLLATVLLCGPLAATARAQMLPGDLLVLSYGTGRPTGWLRHYRPDGTLVVENDDGTGDTWWGAAVLPDGDWVCTRWHPSQGLDLFDGTTGVETGRFEVPVVAMDVAVLSDRTLVVLGFLQGVARVDLAGNVLGTWTVPGAGFTTTVIVDGQDHVWISDGYSLFEYDAAGQLLGTSAAGVWVHDLALAPDGTFWVASTANSVTHLDRTGAVLGSFKTLFIVDTVAVAADGSLWAAGMGTTEVWHFTPTGGVLGHFPAPGSKPTRIELGREPGGPIGASYCGPATLNSTGASAEIGALGSDVAQENLVQLRAVQLPPNQPGYFLVSPLQGFVPFAGGSQGHLCLGGGIGRYAADVADSGAAGQLVRWVDLTAVPTPSGTVTAVAGETWNWQCWFRDLNPGPTSNFTDGVSITLL